MRTRALSLWLLSTLLAGAAVCEGCDTRGPISDPPNAGLGINPIPDVPQSDDSAEVDDEVAEPPAPSDDAPAMDREGESAARDLDAGASADAAGLEDAHLESDADQDAAPPVAVEDADAGVTVP